jgi:hypothetical protein
VLGSIAEATDLVEEVILLDVGGEWPEIRIHNYALLAARAWEITCDSGLHENHLGDEPKHTLPTMPQA